MNEWESPCILLLSVLEHAFCNFPMWFPDLLLFPVYDILSQKYYLKMILVSAYLLFFPECGFFLIKSTMIMTHAVILLIFFWGFICCYYKNELKLEEFLK